MPTIDHISKDIDESFHRLQNLIDAQWTMSNKAISLLREKVTTLSQMVKEIVDHEEEKELMMK